MFLFGQERISIGRANLTPSFFKGTAASYSHVGRRLARLGAGGELAFARGLAHLPAIDRRSTAGSRMLKIARRTERETITA
jgi:hypothetical protein